MRLLITNGVQQGRVLQLKPGLNRIGRSLDNHLQVPDPSISSNHCEVTYSDAGVFVRDLNSTNGTFINGEQIEEGAVELGHSMQLGNVEMRLEDPLVPLDAFSVQVPELPREQPVSSPVLEDGLPACANHPELAGAYVCTQCGQALCSRCVRIIRRTGGHDMVFCSLCAGQCEPVIAAEASEAAEPAKRLGLFDRLTHTFRRRK